MPKGEPISIVEMTPEQLRHFIQHHHEKEFVVNDVRQPGEYEHGHIPGARLILLPEKAHMRSLVKAINFCSV